MKNSILLTTTKSFNRFRTSHAINECAYRTPLTLTNRNLEDSFYNKLIRPF
jgi:hypothetical protein